MPLFDPQFKPGIQSEGTEVSSTGRWIDGNLVRWHANAIRPVGGWERKFVPALTGKPRATFSWRTNSLYRMSVCGTHSKLYAITPSAIFDITPADLAAGLADTFINVGYGIGYYDQGLYGTPRAEGIAKEATTWSFSNFGEWLLAVNTTDGRLFKWDPNATSSVAAAISSAPVDNQGVIVTPQRHVLLYGAGGDKRKLQWSSSETIDVWAPSATNSAGYLELPSTEPVRAAKTFRNGVAVFAESSVYFLNYVGYPYIYSHTEKSGNTSIVSPHSIVNVNDSLVWMGVNKFFLFDGSLREVPCSVRDFVFEDFNWTQATKTFGFYLPNFSEAWWFFPTDSKENDRYVVWNTLENVWYTGYVSRAAGWFSPSWEKPILIDENGVIYEHETGYSADGQALGPARYLTSSPIYAGENHYLIQGIIPDRDPSSSVGFVVEARGWPEVRQSLWSSGVLSGGPYIDTRLHARAFTVKLVGITDSNWELGSFKLDTILTGRRKK